MVHFYMNMPILCPLLTSTRTVGFKDCTSVNASGPANSEQHPTESDQGQPTMTRSGQESAAAFVQSPAAMSSADGHA